jgi:hypothetical protein
MHAPCKGAGKHGSAQVCPSNREEHHIVPMNRKRTKYEWYFFSALRRMQGIRLLKEGDEVDYYPSSL